MTIKQDPIGYFHSLSLMMNFLLCLQPLDCLPETLQRIWNFVFAMFHCKEEYRAQRRPPAPRHSCRQFCVTSPEAITAISSAQKYLNTIYFKM